MDTLRTAILVAACAALSACTLPMGEDGSDPEERAAKQRSVEPPAGWSRAWSARVSGSQQFRCARDSQGAYWKFVRPEARFAGPDGTRIEQLSDGSFTSSDGGRLTATIVRAAPMGKRRSLRWVLYSAHKGSGALQGIGYVQRVNTTGGIPHDGCSPAQLGQSLSVPFTAEFVFWRRAR